MKELQEILKKLDMLKPEENAVLATVVDVKGSSYRLPGAKMLILKNGEACGTVSGGCLEADVLERSKKVLETGKPQIFVYDTKSNEDSVFGFNMGCRGIVRILLEPIQDNPFIDFVRKCFEGNLGVAATFIESNNGETIGERFFFEENREPSGDPKAELIRQHALEVLSTGISRLEEYDFGEVFIEYIAPPKQVMVFGCGADAVPLAEIAKSLGWHVTIIDHRTALANHERFQNVDEIIIARPEEIAARVSLSKKSVTVLMTHNYDHDKEILKALFESNVKYIGLLGPHVRTENILREFREEGVKVSDENLRNLHGPVGLDIGAELPETIALSIIAEIQSVVAGREGGFLRNRKGSIYGRE